MGGMGCAASAWAALAAHAHPSHGVAPVRGQHPLGLAAWGVTEPDGRFRLSPLGTVNRRRCFLARFVHAPELVFNQGFEWSALRKRADVGLKPPANVVASVACPGPPLLSLVKAGLV